MGFFSRLFRRTAETGSVRLKDVARRVTVLETVPAAPAALVADGVLPTGATSLFRGWKSDPATLCLYDLRDVVLDRSLMVFLKDGKPLLETAYLQDPAAVAALRIRPADVVQVPDQPGPVAACFDHWDSNYYHWLSHTVPTLQALRTTGHGAARLILPAGLRPWQAEILALSGFDAHRSVLTEHGKQYAFRRVLYADYVRGAADFSVSPLSQAAYRSLGTGQPATGPRDLRIFIERGAASNRKIPNEAELTVALQARGFVCVRPETLPVAEQIRLFNRARLVVGQLGAGISNCVWCQPGTVVFELVAEHHQNPCDLLLAMQAGLQYWGKLMPTGQQEDNHTAQSEQPLDIASVLQELEQIEAYLPPV
ncbi:MAG: glycosyltransferase 61 family protein [Acetobacter persici]|uniref:glycosyltransferase family 61 protein n=1 Tax=Acetobacter persici TaxID=1076596 RepID=UPI0039EC4221